MANFHWLVLLCLALLTAMTAATQFKVGGSMGWTLPTDPNAVSYNQWAMRYRFKMGDSLLFVYPPNKDSVLQVDKEAYNSCNTSSYIERFDDGNSVFTLSRSGPFYFISGIEENCIKNESLAVVVLADRSNRSSGLNQPSMAPSPPPASPPPPPASEASSSPPSPPPSPSASTEVTPSPPPVGEQTSPPPAPNGASPKVVAFMGTIGALIGSLFVL